MTAEEIRAIRLEVAEGIGPVQAEYHRNLFLREIAAQLAEANQMQREQIASAAKMVETFRQTQADNPRTPSAQHPFPEAADMVRRRRR